MKREIPKTADLAEEVFATQNDESFNAIALSVYHFQFANNPLYRDYCIAIGRPEENLQHYREIPFLPISFFKTHSVRTTDFEPEAVFRSSGTTATGRSRHELKRTALYRRSFLTAFENRYGPVSKYCILGLLPSYLENGDSSLVFMVDELVRLSGHAASGFYAHEHEKLHSTLQQLEQEGQPTLLIGVSYALLQFALGYPQKLRHTIIMETGGMKGRSRELTRAELHEALRAGFGVNAIHSEYGMTELLSQAYGINGIFSTPPWMKVLLREETDPFSFSNASGLINLIDLANLYSCAFIATDDAGRFAAGGFEVSGRLDHSDIRGCSLLL